MAGSAALSAGSGVPPGAAEKTGRMADIRADVTRMLARCEAPWTPEVERAVAAAQGGGTDRLLPAAAGALRASWNEGGRSAAVAAVALLETALETGARDDPMRPRWVLHLWLAERTLSFRYGDHRLSQDIQHTFGAQTQGRSPDDPVAVAAVYPDGPLPRHGEPVAPVERAALRLAGTLPPDDPGRRSLLVRLALAAAHRHESGDPAALTDAWQWARDAYEGLAVDHIEAHTVANAVAHLAGVWFRAHMDDEAATELGVRAGRSALAAVRHAQDHGAAYVGYDLAVAHSTMAQALMCRASWDLSRETIDAAIEHLEAFREAGPPDDGGMYAGNMASMLAARGFLTRSRGDLTRAADLLGRLEKDLPPGHPLAAPVAQKRAACEKLADLMRRVPFDTSGLLRLLRPHARLLMIPTALPPIQVLAPLPSPGYRSPGPGPADFRERFGDLGSGPPDADASRRAPAGPGAVPGAPAGGGWSWPPVPGPGPAPAWPQEADTAGLPPDAAAVLGALDGSTGVPVDPRRLEPAERQLRARLAEPGLTEGQRGWTATVLMHVLAARLAADPGQERLLAAVRTGDTALAGLSPAGSRYVGLLDVVETHRLALGGLTEDVPTMVRAQDGLCWALEHAPAESTLWVQCAYSYGMALAGVARLRRDADAARRAVALLTEAAQLLDRLEQAVPPGSPQAVVVTALRVQVVQVAAVVGGLDAELRHDVHDAHDRKIPWDRAAGAALPPAARFAQARGAAERAMEDKDMAGVADAVEAALEVLPLLTSRALDRDARQEALRTALLGGRAFDAYARGARGDLPDRLSGTSLGRTGCAAAVSVGAVDRAAVLLEQGRTVLMNQDLEARADLTDLAAAEPGLAARFTAAAERLSRAETAAAGAGAGPLVDEQDAAAAQWRALLAEIRSRPGFTGFLAPPTADAIRAEAAHGPIALINVDKLRCDALVVTPDAIVPVHLKDVTEGLVARMARDFLAAAAVEDRRGTRAEEARETVFRTLEWLWDALAEPVLEAAGLTRPLPPDTPWQDFPRIWWSASGPLAHLPLHAAGYQRKGRLDVRRSVLDRVASSYTPSVRALRHARQAPVPAGDGRPHLAVGQPTGADGSAGASAHEIAMVARRLGDTRILDGAEATAAAVLAALESAGIAHFACHGLSDPADPSRSRLELADGPLEVPAIARQRLRTAQLAVLLACHTARTDRLPDEAIHIASAFLTAGYPQVVGTLWAATDLVSVRFADRLYGRLRRFGGGVDPAQAGRAVTADVRELRVRYASSPATWAAYVHTGR